MEEQSSQKRKSAFSLRRLWAALLASAAGFRAAFRDEAAFRLEVAIVAALLPVAFYADVSATERALLILSLLLVPLAELFNTAVEAAVDWTSENRAKEKRHPLAAKAKDAASAAVLLAIVIAVAVWLAVLLPAF